MSLWWIISVYEEKHDFNYYTNVFAIFGTDKSTVL